MKRESKVKGRPTTTSKIYEVFPTRDKFGDPQYFRGGVSRISKSDRIWLREKAEREGTSPSALIRDALTLAKEAEKSGLDGPLFIRFMLKRQREGLCSMIEAV